MKFRKQGKYASCQLVAAINAGIFLGMTDVSDELFEELVDLTLCRHGSCICVEAAYSVLGLEYVDMDKRRNKLKWIGEHLPVEIGYIDKKRGFHSALVVKVEDDVLYLINSSQEMMKWDSIEFMRHTHNQKYRGFSRVDTSTLCLLYYICDDVVVNIKNQ